jgi:rhamnosyltransferase subunit B
VKVFIAAIGSDGDLLPMLGLGVELQRRGHKVMLVGNTMHERSVHEAGLDFLAVLTSADFERFTARAKEANESGAGWVAFFQEMVLPAMVNTYLKVSERLVAQDTVLIGSSHAIGLRLLQEKHGVPLVITRLQPESIEEAGASDAQMAFFNRQFTQPLNHYRKRLGLAPISQRFDRWVMARERAVALFPPWFPDPRVDAPNQGHTVDFVFFDPAPVPDTRQLDLFLARHEPPIVFTQGTGNDNVGEFFEVALRACALLDKPAIFLTRQRAKLPPNLPPNVMQLNYISLARLLPWTECIVHHGGIGTCAQALKAGIAQLVVPLGFDQHQNARRVECLGVGLQLERSNVVAENLAQQLDGLLKDTPIRNRCLEFARRFVADDGVARCCDAIEMSWKR